MGRATVTESRREFYARQARCHGRYAAQLAKAVSPHHLGFADGEEWKLYDWARIAGHFGLLALRKPCGCEEDDPMCFHGLLAIIGSCEEFPITWRSDYLGIDRSTFPKNPSK